MKELTSELIEKVRIWLSSDGIDLFSGLLKEHGKINCCYTEKAGETTIPHPVHFREGMQVRNFLRGTGLCDDWTAHDYDDNWVNVIEQAITFDDMSLDEAKEKYGKLNDNLIKSLEEDEPKDEKMSNDDIIKELKIASKAYSIADEYDSVPFDDEDGYDPELEHYIGCSPYDVTQRIINLIDKLK